VQSVPITTKVVSSNQQKLIYILVVFVHIFVNVHKDKF
jgi:hypothetical protein